MKDFMKLERMLIRSSAYRQILTSPEMSDLLEDTMSDFASRVHEHYYLRNPLVEGSGQMRRYRQSINPSGNPWEMGESKAALLRALETMRAEA